MTKALDAASVGEVAAVLAGHPNLRCRPSLDVDAKAGEYTLTIALPYNDGNEPAELFYELREAIDMATLRGIAARYGIDAGSVVEQIAKRRE